MGIRTGKITANVLRAALRAYLQSRKERKQQARAEENIPIEYTGKQSLQELKSSGQELLNVEITKSNIRGFEKYARKYEIDYSLKRVAGSDPPKYYVFFKARDAKTLEAAFKAYTQTQIKQKPSIRQKLEKTLRRTLPHRQRARVKNRERAAR